MIAQARIDDLERSQPQALGLARLDSPAVMIEPQLLRRLRLRLLPTADVGVEADLWFSGVVDSRGVDSIVLDREVASLLRSELRREPALLARVLAEIEEAHGHLRQTLRLEERLIRVALQGAGASEVERSLQPALRTLYTGGAQARSLAHWALRALPEDRKSVV